MIIIFFFNFAVSQAQGARAIFTRYLKASKWISSIIILHAIFLSLLLFIQIITL